jgi:hypothetical protein
MNCVEYIKQGLTGYSRHYALLDGVLAEGNRDGGLLCQTLLAAFMPDLDGPALDEIGRGAEGFEAMRTGNDGGPDGHAGRENPPGNSVCGGDRRKHRMTLLPG